MIHVWNSLGSDHYKRIVHLQTAGLCLANVGLSHMAGCPASHAYPWQIAPQTVVPINRRPPQVSRIPSRGQFWPCCEFFFATGDLEMGDFSGARLMPFWPTATRWMWNMQLWFPAGISSNLHSPFAGRESNKLQAYRGGQGKAISIRGGSLRSQANTDKLCNTGGTMTQVIYPPLSQSARALQEGCTHTPIFLLFPVFERKGKQNPWWWSQIPEDCSWCWDSSTNILNSCDS